MSISPAVLAGALWIFHACAPGAPPDILAGIAYQESGYDSTAIYDNTARYSYSGSHSPGNPNAAVDLAVSLVAKGHQIDVGLLGIDYTTWVRHDTPIMAAFDGCANARISEQVLMGDHAGALKAGYTGQAAWFAALSAYNSGGYATSVGYNYASSVLANVRLLSNRLAVAQAVLNGQTSAMLAPRGAAPVVPAQAAPVVQYQPPAAAQPPQYPQGPPAQQAAPVQYQQQPAPVQYQPTATPGPSPAYLQALAIAHERQREASEHYSAILHKLSPSPSPTPKHG